MAHKEPFGFILTSLINVGIGTFYECSSHKNNISSQKKTIFYCCFYLEKNTLDWYLEKKI